MIVLLLSFNFCLKKKNLHIISMSQEAALVNGASHFFINFLPKKGKSNIKWNMNIHRGM